MRGLNEIGDQGAVAVATAQDLEDLDKAVGTVETVNMVAPKSHRYSQALCDYNKLSKLSISLKNLKMF